MTECGAMRRLFLPLLAAGLLAPAIASAQTETTTTPVPPPAAEPAPTVPAPLAPTPKLSVTIERTSGSQRAVIAGFRFVVRGRLEQFVAGQRFRIALYRGARKVAVKAVTLQRSGSKGVFAAGFTATGSGRLLVRVSHRQTPQLDTIVAAPRHVLVLARSAAPGDRGLVVRLLQRRLAALGYVVGKRGFYDDRTTRAVLAFRKLTGMSRIGVAGSDVFAKLARGAGAFKVRYPGHGHHVEADLTHQVLALIDRGKVQRIYPLSSGKPSTPTVLGNYSVYMKDPGYNAKGMYYSSYFTGGYAIHGYAEVPIYPASHGCLRVPVPDAVSIYDWVRYGDRVDTYYR